MYSSHSLYQDLFERNAHSLVAAAAVIHYGIGRAAENERAICSYIAAHSGWRKRRGQRILAIRKLAQTATSGMIHQHVNKSVILRGQVLLLQMSTVGRDHYDTIHSVIVIVYGLGLRVYEPLIKIPRYDLISLDGSEKKRRRTVGRQSHH
jgi:hypothetical protein